MPSKPLSERVYVAAALALWLATFAVVVVELLGGRVATDVWHVYAAAAQRWRAGAPLYDARTIDDFQYFPQAALVFVPLARLGRPLGDVVWRGLGWACFAHALWRACALAPAATRGRLFAVASALVVAPAMISLFNGQANLHVAALMMQAAVDLARQRRWRVTLWLMLGLALKPLAAVMGLLVCVFDPAMIGPMALGAGLLALAPAAAAPVGYVIAQYRDYLPKLAASAQPARHFEDLRGLSWRLGWTIPYGLLRALALGAALGAALLGRRLRRQWALPAAGVLLFAVAAAYLMLFNARTQANSYVIVAPCAALPAAGWALARRYRAAAGMTLLLVCWSGSAVPATACWLKPLGAVVLATLVVRTILTRRRGWEWFAASESARQAGRDARDAKDASDARDAR